MLILVFRPSPVDPNNCKSHTSGQVSRFPSPRLCNGTSSPFLSVAHLNILASVYVLWFGASNVLDSHRVVSVRLLLVRRGSSLLSVLLVLQLPPVRLGRLVSIRDALAASKGGLASIQLVALAGLLGLLELLKIDGLVAAESLAHVDHASSAVTEGSLELLALLRKGLDERRTEAVGGRVSVHHNALGLLEALRQGGTWRRGHS